MTPHTTLALYARGHIGRVAPVPLCIALTELDKSASAALIDDAWSAAGAAIAIAEAFDEARAIGGRAIVDVTFALHMRLGLSRTAPPTPFIQLVSLDPYMEWLEPRMAEGSPWRPIVGRWVEIINERLTMHRYADRAHRRRHARDLIAAPLAALANTDPTPDLIDFADRALAFYDLLLANLYASRGWNRIDLPDAGQLGGFYGLADEARPPTADRIAATSAELASTFASSPAPKLSADLDVWLAQISALMADALTRRASDETWPEWPAMQPGWIERLAAQFRRRASD